MSVFMLPVSYSNGLQFYEAVLGAVHPSDPTRTQERLEKDQIPQEPIEQWRKMEVDICEGRTIEIEAAPRIPPNGIIRV
jgi:hypothetical protein